jgi:hypothetical protein
MQSIILSRIEKLEKIIKLYVVQQFKSDNNKLVEITQLLLQEGNSGERNDTHLSNQYI